MTMTPADYRRAAAEIRRRGKATGTYQNISGEVCAMGAMGAALNPRDLYHGLSRITTADIQRVADLIGNSPRGLWPSAWVVNWSERDSTTAEDIALLMEQCAEKLEASEVISTT